MPSGIYIELLIAEGEALQACTEGLGPSLTSAKVFLRFQDFSD